MLTVCHFCDKISKTFSIKCSIKFYLVPSGWVERHSNNNTTAIIEIGLIILLIVAMDIICICMELHRGDALQIWLTLYLLSSLCWKLMHHIPVPVFSSFLSLSFASLFPSSSSLPPQGFSAFLSVLLHHNWLQNARRLTPVVLHGRTIVPLPSFSRRVTQLGHLISIFSFWWEMGGGGGNCPDCQNNHTHTRLAHSHTGKHDNWDILLTQNSWTMTRTHTHTCTHTYTCVTPHAREKWAEWGHTKWESRTHFICGVGARTRKERLHSAGRWDSLVRGKNNYHSVKCGLGLIPEVWVREVAQPMSLLVALGWRLSYPNLRELFAFDTL